MLAEQLVGVARERRRQRMDARELRADGVAALTFLAAAVAIALYLPSERSANALVIAGLVVGYALVSRVRFEFGDLYVSLEQLLLVPLLLLAPLPLVPLLVAGAGMLAQLPDFMKETWSRDRWVTGIADSGFCIAPVLVLAALAPGEPEVGLVEVYVLAFAAQVASDVGWTLVRDRTAGHRLPMRTILANYSGTLRVDVVLSPIALVVTFVAVDHPAALLALGPLVYLLELFSRDRRERYAAALDLQRAYRGTVMLLSDLIEFEDPYTAEHSRSMVELVHAVGDELAIEPQARQELEFAALLHDVGKIAIPKEILNKRTSLTGPELELLRTHTIEGQFMLDRVGGLLARVGQLVRSSHERWDGTGYPDGIGGVEIPLTSRIVCVCDAYSAMTTGRTYRAALPREEAFEQLRAGAGSQFDPQVVAALLEVLERGEPAALAADGVGALLASAQLPQRLGATT